MMVWEEARFEILQTQNKLNVLAVAPPTNIEQPPHTDFDAFNSGNRRK